MIASRLQLSSTTGKNRNSAAVKVVQNFLPEARRILSFGCSTGEEVATLRVFWPMAQIVGVDINKDALAEARKKYPNEIFLESKHLSEEPFDIIFAMSVLCRWPESVGGFLPYQEFRDAVSRLDALLKPGGILVAYNAAYDPMTVLEAYTPLAKGEHTGFVTVRTPDGRVRGPNEYVHFLKPWSA